MSGMDYLQMNQDNNKVGSLYYRKQHQGHMDLDRKGLMVLHILELYLGFQQIRDCNCTWQFHLIMNIVY